jgi:multidrug efflux system outer membrane protein
MQTSTEPCMADQQISASPARAMLVAVLTLLAGCAVGPDYTPPETPMPDAWQLELSRGLESGEASISTWWTVFGDDVLDGLIERARSGNLDLRAAVGRVDEARAIRGIARGEWFPAADIGGEYQRQRESESVSGPSGFKTDDFYEAGVDASWELDFFGRIRRSVESSDASLEATIDDYRDALVILFSDVAGAYVGLRTAQSRLIFARENVQAQRETLELTQKRNRAGLSPELDVRQAELNLAQTESAVPVFQQQIAEAIHRLSVLVGAHPSTLRSELATGGAIPTPPPQVALGLPVDLLRQRPDIRAAERTIASNNARIGVATADLYPRFTLLGTFAFSALDATSMFTGDASTFGFGPTMQWSIFNGGRVLSNIRAEEVRTQLALVAYENTVLGALEEASNAIVGFERQSARRDALGRAVIAASESVVLAKRLYKAGLTDFLNVLNMEESLFISQDTSARSQGTVAADLIGIYKALGGGWQPSALEAEPIAGEEAP